MGVGIWNSRRLVNNVRSWILSCVRCSCTCASFALIRGAALLLLKLDFFDNGKGSKELLELWIFTTRKVKTSTDAFLWWEMLSFYCEARSCIEWFAASVHLWQSIDSRHEIELLQMWKPWKHTDISHILLLNTNLYGVMSCRATEARSRSSYGIWAKCFVHQLQRTNSKHQRVETGCKTGTSHTTRVKPILPPSNPLRRHNIMDSEWLMKESTPTLVKDTHAKEFFSPKKLLEELDIWIPSTFPITRYNQHSHQLSRRHSAGIGIKSSKRKVMEGVTIMKAEVVFLLQQG